MSFDTLQLPTLPPTLCDLIAGKRSVFVQEKSLAEITLVSLLKELLALLSSGKKGFVSLFGGPEGDCSGCFDNSAPQLEANLGMANCLLYFGLLSPESADSLRSILTTISSLQAEIDELTTIFHNCGYRTVGNYAVTHYEPQQH